MGNPWAAARRRTDFDAHDLALTQTLKEVHTSLAGAGNKSPGVAPTTFTIPDTDITLNIEDTHTLLYKKLLKAVPLLDLDDRDIKRLVWQRRKGPRTSSGHSFDFFLTYWGILEEKKLSAAFGSDPPPSILLARLAFEAAVGLESSFFKKKYSAAQPSMTGMAAERDTTSLDSFGPSADVLPSGKTFDDVTVCACACAAMLMIDPPDAITCFGSFVCLISP